jgi:hypothetical protein
MYYFCVDQAINAPDLLPNYVNGGCRCRVRIHIAATITRNGT